MKTILKIFAAFSLFFSMSFAHAGIPVVDGLLNGQTIENQIANAITWAAQLEQLKNQFQQAQQAYSAITGARGMATLLNNPAVLSTLPPAYSNVVASIKSGSTYAIERALFPTSGNVKINAIFDAVAVHKAALTDAYSQASARLVQIQQLQTSIDLASDPAAKHDLQNRMVSELQSIQATQHLIAMLRTKQEQDTLETRQAAHQSFICGEFKNSGC